MTKQKEIGLSEQFQKQMQERQKQKQRQNELIKRFREYRLNNPPRRLWSSKKSTKPWIEGLKLGRPSGK